MTHILHVTSMFLRVISDGECMVVKCGFEILLSARTNNLRRPDYGLSIHCVNKEGIRKFDYCCLVTEGERSDRVDVLDA